MFVIDTGCTPRNGGSCSGSFSYNGFDCADDDGHGTHVAGTIQDEIYGVAPSATLSCYKCLDWAGAGWTTDVIRGIEYAVQNGADVINLSLGGFFWDVPIIADAVQEAARTHEIFFTISAGNFWGDACQLDPAIATGSTIFTTQAHDKNGYIAWFSNYGTCTDISAPGVNILSTTIGGHNKMAFPNKPNVHERHFYGSTTCCWGYRPLNFRRPTS